MVVPSFLPVLQLLPGSHHGGLRSSSGHPRPPLPASLASPRRCRRPPPRVPAAQSLRSGASLPGERPGEAPGSCSGSLSLPRPELRQRERAGKPRPGGAAGDGGHTRLRRPLPFCGAAASFGGRGSETPFPRRVWHLETWGQALPPPRPSLPAARLAARPFPACSPPLLPGTRGERGRCFALRPRPPGPEGLQAWQVLLAHLSGHRVYKRAVGWRKKLSLVAEKGQLTDDKSELLLQAYLVFFVFVLFFLVVVDPLKAKPLCSICCRNNRMV